MEAEKNESQWISKQFFELINNIKNLLIITLQEKATVNLVLPRWDFLDFLFRCTFFDEERKCFPSSAFDFDLFSISLSMMRCDLGINWGYLDRFTEVDQLTNLSGSKD